MARWILKCKHCDKVFTHSQISETLADYFLPAKPKFPLEGLKCECPNCKATSIYQQNELRYQNS